MEAMAAVVMVGTFTGIAAAWAQDGDRAPAAVAFAGAVFFLMVALRAILAAVA